MGATGALILEYLGTAGAAEATGGAIAEYGAGAAAGLGASGAGGAAATGLGAAGTIAAGDAATSAAWGQGAAGLGGDTLSAVGADVAGGSAGAGAGLGTGADAATSSAWGQGAGLGQDTLSAVGANAESAATPSMWDTAKTGLKYANTANSAYNFAKNPTLGGAAGLALNAAGYMGDTAAPTAAPTAVANAPVGGVDAGLPSAADSLGTTPPDASNQVTGSPTSTPDAPATGPGGPGTSTTVSPSANAPTPTGNASVDAAMKALGAGGSSLMGGIKEYGPALNAGLAGVSALQQARGVGSAQKAMQGIAQPTKDVSNQLLQQFKTGQISGADAFQIAQFSQQQKAAVDQYYAKAGLSNSSMHTQALQQIDVQAEAMRQQAVQNLLKGGLSAAGVSDPTMVAGVNAGIKQDANAQSAMQNFINTLANMNTPKASTHDGAPN